MNNFASALQLVIRTALDEAVELGPRDLRHTINSQLVQITRKKKSAIVRQCSTRETWPRMVLLFAFLAVALGNGPIVKAVVDIYSSEASWQNAVNGTSLIDFDDLAPDTLLLSQYPGVTFSPFAAGEPRTSSFYTAYSGSNLVIAYPDLTHEANGGGDVQFVFDSPQGGFSFRHLDSQFINTVTLYDSADQVLDTIDLQAPRPLEWVFLGFASSANDIKKVSISVDPGDFVGFDDLSYAGSTTEQSVLVSNLSQPVRDATPIGNNPNPADPVGLPVTPWYWGAQSFQTDNQQHMHWRLSTQWLAGAQMLLCPW